jgi:hypothetical protein
MRLISTLIIAIAFVPPISAQAGDHGGGGGSKTSVSPVSKTPAATVGGHPYATGANSGKSAGSGSGPSTATGAHSGKPAGGSPDPSRATGADSGKRTGYGPAGAAQKPTDGVALKPVVGGEPTGTGNVTTAAPLGAGPKSNAP